MLLGGVKRALEVHSTVDNATNSYPWSLPTTEQMWHAHVEGVLMVALANLNLPPEAWRSARLLRAVPNCRLVVMLAYHMLSPALSIEEAGLMTCLQTPLDAGPSVLQATTGLQNWKCAGRRLVQIGGRLPTANQLHLKPRKEARQEERAAIRAMGVTSVASRETVRFGEESDPELEKPGRSRSRLDRLR